MIIALINKVFSQKGGGGERYATDLATALANFGHEVHLYGAVIEDVPQGIIKHFLKLPSRPGFNRVLGFARNARIAIQRDREIYRFDIVYGLTQVFPVDLYFMGGGMHRHWLQIRMPNPFWRTVRCIFNPTHLAQMWLERQILQHENHCKIISNSILVKNHAVKYGNVSPDRVAVVYNGVDRNVFNSEVRIKYRAQTRLEFGLADNDLALLFVAHNWSRKGLATVIRALGRAQEKGVRYHLFVVGKGEPKSYIRLAQECNVDPDRLHFCSTISNPERLYAAGDVFVLPTMYDPCAGVTIEAMACGLPVITTIDNGAHELIRHGHTGYVMQGSNDDESLAEHLCALTDETLRKKMGRLAEDEIAPRTIEQVVRETISIMEEICAKSTTSNVVV